MSRCTHLALILSLSACELAQQPEPAHVTPAPAPTPEPIVTPPAVTVQPTPSPVEPEREDWRPQSRAYRPWKGEHAKVRLKAPADAAPAEVKK